MIYTITFNPALDYVMEMQDFQTGKINISKKEHILPGGKGINVSIILKTLGIDSTALGFIAGFVGDEIERMVKEYGIKTDFIKIEDDISRINVKITTESQETAMDGKGPFIDQSDIQLLYKKIEKIENEDTLVLAGSIPKGVSTDVYEKICEKLENKNVRIVVDATGDLLLKTLKYKPFLIKPNRDELGDVFDVKISNQDEAIEYAKKLQQKGAKNVLVSMGSMGAVLVDENGYSYKMTGLSDKKGKNTVGAGDSMVAGFLAGYQLFNNYEKALQMGMASGTATAHSMFLATKEEIFSFLWESKHNEKIKNDEEALKKEI